MPKRITENPSFASTSEVLKKVIEYISCTDFIMLKKQGHSIFTSITDFFVLPGLFFSLFIYAEKLTINLQLINVSW